MLSAIKVDQYERSLPGMAKDDALKGYAPVMETLVDARRRGENTGIRISNIKHAFRVLMGFEKPDAVHYTGSENPVLDAIRILDKAGVWKEKDSEIGKTMASKSAYTRGEHTIARRLAMRYKENLPLQLFLDVVNSEYRKPVEKDEEISTVPSIVVDISGEDGVQGLIWNGHEGKISYKFRVNSGNESHASVATLVRFDGVIKKPVKIDGKTNGMMFTLGNEEFVLSAENAVRLFKDRFYLQSYACQRLSEIFNYYITNAEAYNEMELYKTSPISVLDNKILVDYKTSGNLIDILKTLIDYEKYASHPEAYRATLAWALVAPLHYYMKDMAVSNLKCPNLLKSGRTVSGKTSLSNLFIGHGYDMPKKKYFYPFNRVQSLFMLSVHLSESNIPCIIDDVTTKWIIQNSENIKSYAHSGIFADRGRSNQQHTEYNGMRSFVMTLNEDYAIDMDLALASRLGIFSFGLEESNRTDQKRYLALLSSLPKGFMYNLFAATLAGKDIRDIVRDAESFQTTNDWFNYGIVLINKICEENGIQGFQILNGKKQSVVSYAMEIAQSFLGEWARMHDFKEQIYNNEPVKVQKYYSQLSMELDVDELNGRTYIHFTPGALKKLIQMRGLEKIYSTTTEFINNIDNSEDGVMVMNDGRPKSHKFSAIPLKAYTISIKTPDTV